MGDTSKIEAMLEKLLAEDREGADELLHEFVVDASRVIYESILEQDLDDDEEVDESDDDEDEAVDESDDEDEDDVNENFDLDEFEVEADPTDDMVSDVEFGGEEEDDDMDSMNFGGGDMADDEEEGEIEDRVVDLEDAIDDLKAEFDKMMGDDDGDMGDEEDFGSDDEEGDDMDFGNDDEEDFGSDDDEEKEEAYNFESKSNRTLSATEQMREYVEKINGGGLDNNSVLGTSENGAHTKSTLAGKNDMGGTTANIARTDTEAGVEANKGNLKGSALNDQSSKEDSAGNVNVPGGKAGVKHLKAQPKGHGAEKKGSGDTAPNKKQIIGRKK
jgi:hypothetical protein